MIPLLHGGVLHMIQKKSIEIPISYIHANPKQPRKFFAEEELLELKDSIEKYGVLQPVIVKKDGSYSYSLIAGERRLRASKLAGLKKIPAIIKDFDEKDAALISIIENVQRENLSFLEEAKAYEQMLSQYDITQNELAARIGKKQSTISNKLRLLALPDSVVDKLVTAGLTERHARALLKIGDSSSMNKVLDKVIKHNFNVKQTEKLVDDFIAKEECLCRKKRMASYISYKIYLNTIRKAFNQIYDVEKKAVLKESDNGEFVEFTILIPKGN